MTEDSRNAGRAGHPLRTGPIRTPDQRLRVFVSSTLRELADERKAARAAIEGLRLAPVMFELGARPHPPRALYRSYLAQSDVFVGIYGDSYGWVAPDEEVSGLEDEYNLAPREMPKLIYIRASEHRDERLQELIQRIQQDDTAAYLPFETAAELERQIAGDLATLLAERFDEARAQAETDVEDASESLVARVPVPYTTTIGREREIAEVRALLERGDDRVISLIGPGGIGKSRLAIEVARATEDLFPDGTYFVLLEGVLEEELLLPTIAYVLGIRDSGESSLEERISRALAGRRVLIVLDNFEQIVDAAPVLVRLYTVAPRASFLVTSRVVLRIRGEQVYEVGALPSPEGIAQVGLDAAQHSPAVALFVDRARAAKRDFELTGQNAADIADICRRLDGLPLAIELAAAKVRVLPPRAIAERLENSLPLLTGAARDVPERHRTMRTAIEWSVSLLPDVQRDLLEDLGVFARRFTLDAVESVGRGRSWDGQAMDALAALVDASLVTQTEIGGRASFSLLAIMRQYALGRLRERGEDTAMRVAHADTYLALVRRLAPHLRGPAQIEAVRGLELELPNLRAAARHLVYTDRLDDAGDFAWTLLVYWWISGFFSEVRLWMLELLAKNEPIATRTRAIASFYTLWGELWQRPSDQIVAGLGEAVELFRECGDEDAAAMAQAAKATSRMQFPDLDPEIARAELDEAIAQLHALGDAWSESLAETGRGQLGIIGGDLADARLHFDRAVEIAEAADDAFTRIVAGNNVARAMFLVGDVAGAEQEFFLTLTVSTRLHFADGVTYGLEGMCAIAGSRGDAKRAGMLAAAARGIRETTGIFDVPGFAVHEPVLAALREAAGEAVAAGEAEGAELTIADAIRLALPDADERGLREALLQW